MEQLAQALFLAVCGVFGFWLGSQPRRCRCPYKHLRHNGREWVCKTCGRRP